MEAVWDVIETAAMSREANLRNVCRQLEQQYVDWARSATHGRHCLAHEWPAIGELGRGSVAGVVVRFVTTRRRSIVVRDSQGTVHGEVKMLPGMAEQLYVLAGGIEDSQDGAQ